MARDTTSDATLPAPVGDLDPDSEELWSSRALLLVLVLLILSFWVSYYLKVRRIKTIHETLVALFAGMVIGFILRISPGVVVQNMVSFKNTIMLNVLLPPIILNSGFEMRQENFFRSFGVILAFAFAGTFISAVVLGVLVYVWALLGLEGLSLTIVECLMFGSTLSATDPVTILAIFNTFKVDPKLYSIVFGESLLNDAVAIVMFETLSQFHGEKIHVLSFFHGAGIFLLVFFTSMALGVVFGLGCSLMLKHSQLAQFPEIESCLVLLIAYCSYFFSNGVTMSGIVTLLFCGITLKHYAYHNMSRRTQRVSRYMLHTLSQLAENFIFIYLGLGLFTQTRLVYKPLFIIVTALGCCLARYCAVFPISKLINLIFRARGRRADELPHSYQMMLFWAGLRGAVGVALAAGLKGDNGPALRTTVLVTVVLTVVVFGGTTSRMIEIVGIRTGVVDDEESTDDEFNTTLSSYHAMNGKFPMHLDDPSSPGDTPFREAYLSKSANTNSSRRSPPPNKRHSAAYNPAAAPSARRSFSRTSLSGTESDEEDDRGDSPPSDAGDDLPEGRVWRNGQWFNVLDERYLLPVFSNATASRRQAVRKSLRSKSRTALDRAVTESDGDLADTSSSTVWMTPPNTSGPTRAQKTWMERVAPAQSGPGGSARAPSRPELGFSGVMSALVGGSSSSAAAVPATGRVSPTFTNGNHKRRESGPAPNAGPASSDVDDTSNSSDATLRRGSGLSTRRATGDVGDANASGASRPGATKGMLVDLLQEGSRSAGT